MGKEKYQTKIGKLFAKSPVVDAVSIARTVRSKKKASQYHKQLIRNLLLSGKIKRLAKGYYTALNDPSLAVFCFPPAYLGLQDALSARNLWEQETIPVIITSRKIRPGIRKILGSNVLVRRLDRRYMFGIEYLKVGDTYLPYSDAEKSLIDMVYFKEPLSGEALVKIIAGLKKKRLASHLKAYPKKVRERVMAIVGTA